jgi:ParB-like chromosome segregation protein Spo0J
MKVGFRAPILIDEKNIILAGHGRLLAAKKA